jgi:hypothetical protein
MVREDHELALQRLIKSPTDFQQPTILGEVEVPTIISHSMFKSPIGQTGSLV